MNGKYNASYEQLAINIQANEASSFSPNRCFLTAFWERQYLSPNHEKKMAVKVDDDDDEFADSEHLDQ